MTRMVDGPVCLALMAGFHAPAGAGSRTMLSPRRLRSDIAPVLRWFGAPLPR